MIRHVAADALWRAATRRYWLVVEACLIELHGLPEHEASAQCMDLRKRIDSAPPEIDQDIFYHAEPFDVACDIAGKELDWEKHRQQYLAILAKYGW